MTGYRNDTGTGNVLRIGSSNRAEGDSRQPLFLGKADAR